MAEPEKRGVNMAERYKLLIVASHPVQYAAPAYREMAAHPRLDLLVAYCSLQGAEEGLDPEFGVKVAWDVPLLEGYRWVHVPNRSPMPGIGGFFGLINPGLWSLIRRGSFDAVLIYGYNFLSYWIAGLAARRAGCALLMGTDAVQLKSKHGGWWWKRWVKGPFVRFVYGLPDIVTVPSTRTRRFLRTLGIADERMTLTHYTVNNHFFTETAACVDRAAVRASWQIPADALVALYGAKLAPWKRPQDLLEALARMRPTDAPGPAIYAVFAGEGALRKELEARAETLGLKDRVRFLGFVNQRQLPMVYAAADLLVLPSENEPWGLVVNEAMACGIPAVVSDQVGAATDLIVSGETGEVFPVGDVDALAAILAELHYDRAKLARLASGARERIAGWSYADHVAGMVDAVGKAVARCR